MERFSAEELKKRQNNASKEMVSCLLLICLCRETYF